MPRMQKTGTHIKQVLEQISAPETRLGKTMGTDSSTPEPAK